MSDRAKYWQGLVASWAKSGLSQAEFCRRRGVKAVTFGWWRRRLAEGTDDHENADGRRVPPRRRKPGGRSVGEHAAFVEVVLPQGVVVRVPGNFDPAQVTGLLRAVVSAC